MSVPAAQQGLVSAAATSLTLVIHSSTLHTQIPCQNDCCTLYCPLYIGMYSSKTLHTVDSDNIVSLPAGSLGLPRMAGLATSWLRCSLGSS